MPPRLTGNLMDYVPRRTVESEPGPSGEQVLLAPRFRSWPFTLLLKRMPKPFMKIRLDEVGSFLWERIDGERTLGELALALSQEFGDRVEPAPQRVGLFFRDLMKGHFVCLERPEGTEAES